MSAKQLQLNIKISTALQKDLKELELFFNQQEAGTLKNFKPHPFDFDNLKIIIDNSTKYHAYIARNISQNQIVAYSVIYLGYTSHDFLRLKQCGFNPDPRSDCSYAPYVSPLYQGIGIGQMQLNYIKQILSSNSYKRILLWGGVSASNKKALTFYKRSGFKTINSFEHNGLNYDMLLQL